MSICKTQEQIESDIKVLDKARTFVINAALDSFRYINSYNQTIPEEREAAASKLENTDRALSMYRYLNSTLEDY